MNLSGDTAVKPLLLTTTFALLAAGGRADAATATASIGVTILGTGGADPAARRPRGPSSTMRSFYVHANGTIYSYRWQGL